jgi:glucosamine 6-phosphate synthetase-like amidotransferase/phosphosugar isomerase protein
MMVKAHQYGSSIYLLACGTSFHAAKSAAIFFDRIAGINLYPLLPGEFRAQCANSLRDRDVIIGISQSGETKDLIDIFNMVTESEKNVTLISIVNNVNSSLAIEKSELFIPLFCGPEISVPATKSFLNQLLVLYILALRVSEKFVELGIKRIDNEKILKYSENLKKIPSLIRETIETSQKSIEEISETLYLEPSMHILAIGMLGIAKEAALKIREVVLNHTEGFEGSEFKHGPNTILGVNTIFGLNSIRAVLGKYGEMFASILDKDEDKKLTAKDMCELFKDTSNYVFHDKKDISNDREKLLIDSLENHNFFESLYSNYPLIFATNSTEKDVNLTISQINTHKIRGANIFIVAEENNLLRDAIEKVPDTLYKDRYKHGYIVLPETGDELLPTFTTTIVFQLLALEMSKQQMRLLNKLEISDHGVHPDSPKNVSKSITVD